MAQSLDSSIAYMFIGSIVLFSFLFINAWAINVIQYCPKDMDVDCIPISYELVSWFSDLSVTKLAQAEALTVTGWFLALFLIILSYAFYSEMYDTKEGFLEKYLPIGIMISLVISVIGQIWWLNEVQKLEDKYFEIKPGFGYYLLLVMSVIAIYFAFLGWQDKKLMMKSEDNLISYENSRERY
ncbi:MAG: hypothetical protein ACTSYA_00630 [Candidatus Kariarchaeaceae archaeon]